MAHNAIRIFTLTLAIAVGLISNAANAAGSGTFKGLAGHVTKGNVTVTKNADGSATVTLAADFFFDGAPDPHVGFGKNGKYTRGTDISLLNANTGAQTYLVPATINVDDFNEVYIWCEKFTVALGVASLK